MLNKKKIIISIVIGIVLVAIVTTGTLLIINVINNSKNDNSKVTPTEATAKSLRDQAEAARKDANTTKSKELLLEAQKQYETLPKTDVNTNAKADIELQLNLLKATSTPTPTQ